MTHELLGLAIGFAAWWATGIDDFLIILTFMLRGHSRSQTLAISIGTLLSVLLMLGISISVYYTVSAILCDYAYLFGTIPICFGLWGIVKLIKHGEYAEETNKHSGCITFLSLGLASFSAYLSNSSDDIIFNSSLLQLPLLNTWGVGRWGFLVGILCGTVSTLILALMLRNAGERLKVKFRHSRVLENVFSHKGFFINCTIIMIGILILLGIFSTG
jgi:cadmium resistance protein CadD (predicted permease)